MIKLCKKFVLLLGVLAAITVTNAGWAQGFQQSVLSADVPNAWSVATADFNGDGNLDVVATEKLGAVVWIENTGSGFITHPILNTGLEVRGVAAGDFNGDGRPDIVFASYGMDQFVFLENTGLSGDSRFVPHVLSTGHGAWSVHAGDVNGDGLLDIVTTDYLGNTVRVFEQRNGALVQTMAVNVTSPFDAVFADFNGDGVMDVVGSADTQPLFWVEHHAADSTWTRHYLNGGTYCTDVAVADFDSNGTLDIVAAPYSSANFKWWQHVAGDSLIEHVLSGTASNPRSVGVADFDQDGHPDIVASAQDGTMRWWHNAGNGVFAARTMTAGSSLYDLTICDFDQDGDPDVLVADRSASAVLLYRNTMGVPAVVTGTVRAVADSTPISGVHLRLLETGSTAISDNSGAFRIAGVAGTYTLRAQRACWNDTLISSVQIARGETTHVDVSMVQPQIEAGVTSLNLVAHNGVDTEARLPITNRGNGPLTLTATAYGAYANDQWLTVTPDSAVVAAGENFSFAVSVHPDTSNSRNWDYYGGVILHDNACPDSVMNIAVIVYVLDAPARETGIPLRTELRPAYPNPFNSTATLSFDLAARADVKLMLFDITGRTVRTITSGSMAAGRYRMPFDAENLPSGLYLLALHAGGERFTQKLLLIK